MGISVVRMDRKTAVIKDLKDEPAPPPKKK